MILPSNAGDIPSVVAQALTIYKTLSGTGNPVVKSTDAPKQILTELVSENQLNDFKPPPNTDLRKHVAPTFEDDNLIDIELDTIHGKVTPNNGKSERKKK